MAKNTVNGKAPNKGELVQIGNFLKQYIPKLTVDEILRVLNPCCRPVILSADATCAEGGLYDISLTFSVPRNHTGTGFLNVKDVSGGWLYLNCDDETGICTVPNIPNLVPGPQDIQVIVVYTPIIGQNPDTENYGGAGFALASAPYQITIPACVT